jgi:hypothetical protein
MNYRLWVNDERTVLVRMWDDGTVETATRETAAHTWGPPAVLTEENAEPIQPNPANALTAWARQIQALGRRVEGADG